MTFAISRSLQLRPPLVVRWVGISADNYVPSARTDEGRELALVYIGSSSCVWSNVAGLPAAVRALKERVKHRAEESGRSFAAIGIAVDRSTEAGLTHLNKLGAFDEVITGRGWLNIGVIKYLHEDMPGQVATPQIVIVDRWVGRGTRTGMFDETVVVRKIGASEIERWARAGAPLPTLAPLSSLLGARSR